MKNKLRNIVRLIFTKVINRLVNRSTEIQKIYKLEYLTNGLVTNSSISAKTVLNVPYRISDSTIGDYSYVAEGGILSNVSIGKFCSIGPFLLAGYGIHPLNGISTSPMFYSNRRQNGFSLSEINKIEERKPIIIGNDVFIGANVTILDGVTIGDGAVIGAGAVVSKNIPPYAIAVGSPIKIIKYRFSDSDINELLEIKWWNWDEDKLNIVEENFFDLKEFISKHKVGKHKPH